MDQAFPVRKTCYAPKPLCKTPSKFAYVPDFLLSNVMSLTPTIDEVRNVVRRENFKFVNLVETWLRNDIHDTVIDIQGYNPFRRDRINGQHGDVSICIRDQINCESINDLHDDQFEVLWTNMNMTRLLRGFNI